MADQQISMQGSVVDSPKGPFWKRRQRDIISMVITALCNAEVKRGTKDAVHISGRNLIIELKDSASTSPTSPGMVYTGEFSQVLLGESDDPYNPGDVTRVSDNNDASTAKGGPSLPGVYICVQQPGANDYPKNPRQLGGENVCWNWLATWPSNEMGCIDGTPTPVIRDSQEKPAEG